MNNHANIAKKHILDIIAVMGKTPEKFARIPNAFSRKRKFDFATLIRFILSFGSNSLGHEITEFFGYKRAFPSVSAFVQQREKLSYTALEHLFKEFHARTDSNLKLYEGYRLFAIDGSDLSLPYNPVEGNVIADRRVSTLHLNVMYDICNKRFVDVIVQKGLMENESGAACDLVDRAPSKCPTIILADRGYESYNLFAHIEKRNFDYVIRTKDVNSTGILSGMDLPDSEEFDITRQLIITRHAHGPTKTNRKKYKFMSKSARFDFVENSTCPDYAMSIRFVRFKLADGSYETLATSLSESEFPVEALKDLYHQRWGVETGFRELKYILGLAAFHSKKENSILQEVYARLVMYNFSMSIMMKVRPNEKDRRYQLQVNFTQATKICVHFFKCRDKAPPFDVEATILRFFLPKRPNRQQQRIDARRTVVSFNYRLT